MSRACGLCVGILVLVAASGCPRPAPTLSLIPDGRYLGTATGVETRLVNNVQVSTRNRSIGVDLRVDGRGQLRTNNGAPIEANLSIDGSDDFGTYTLTVSGITYNPDGASINLRLLVTPADGSAPLSGDATITVEQVSNTTLEYTQSYEVNSADGLIELRGTFVGEIRR